MDAYTSFAQVYDLFMDNVPYEKWCDFIEEILKRYGIAENILLDLACGTGKMTRIMAAKGYDMIGVDSSAEMLDIAREQDGAMEQEILWEGDWEEDTDSDEPSEDDADFSFGSGNPQENEPDWESRQTEEYLKEMGMEEEYYDHAYEGKPTGNLYLCQDMRELELYGTIGACYCSCNSLNYILEEQDLKKVFELVNNYLFPKGLFIFDINSAYKYEKVLADNTIAESRPEGSFIWNNYYDSETGINEYDLTLFIREDQLREEEDYEEYEMDDVSQLPYYRFQEGHYQKCYTMETILRLLDEAGMEFVAAFDNYSDRPVRNNSEIITFIAREKGKTL